METQPIETEERWSETVKASKRMVQAYKQAPWRIQTQWGVLALIATILGASALWVMVSVSVQAADAGLEIQSLEYDRETALRRIAGLRTEIGILTSKARMEQRAADMGFESVKPEDITYMVSPSYTGRQSVIQAAPPGASPELPLIKPVYSQSLWDWLMQYLTEISGPGSVVP